MWKTERKGEGGRLADLERRRRRAKWSTNGNNRRRTDRQGSGACNSQVQTETKSPGVSGTSNDVIVFFDCQVWGRQRQTGLPSIPCHPILWWSWRCIYYHLLLSCFSLPRRSICVSVPQCLLCLHGIVNNLSSENNNKGCFICLFIYYTMHILKSVT